MSDHEILLSTPACADSCLHRCPECRMGLGSHLMCDPQCEHRSRFHPAIQAPITPHLEGEPMSENDSANRSHGHRSRIKRSLRRLSERITRETSLEEIVGEITLLHERAQGYLAQQNTAKIPAR